MQLQIHVKNLRSSRTADNVVKVMQLYKQSPVPKNVFTQIFYDVSGIVLLRYKQKCLIVSLLVILFAYCV